MILLTGRGTLYDEKRLYALQEEATVDCYDEEEEFTGVLITLNEHIAWPLKAE